MADDADKADNLSNEYLNQALKVVLNYTPIPFSGRCLACNDPVENRRYCDSHCRETHEKRLRRKR